MEYSYTAVSPAGEKQKGLIEATNEKEVASYLRSNNLVPVHIGAHTSLIPEISIGGVTGVKNSDVVLFTRQLSSMILTGLTLIESLNILKNQTNKPQLKQVISDVAQSISEGNSFSQALSAHPKVFSKVYIALIRAAESAGLMDKILARLADNLEKSENLKKSVRSALFYPAIVIVGIVGVITVMNIFVIPQLGTLYSSLNISLPPTTQFVLAMSKFTTQYYLIVIPALVVAFFVFKKLSKTDSGIRTLDKVKVHIPVIGQIIVLSTLDEITRTLSIMITSGSTIIDSLNITADVAGNVWYQDALKNAAVQVEKGVSVSDAFAGQQLFPSILVQMIKVGESTGKIDDSLSRVGDYFDRDLNLKVKTLTTSIEPILIVVLGVTVGFLILSVITPIYSLISQIQ